MRLYHMTSLDVATKFILKDKRMRLSRFNRLNDPFELMGWKLEGAAGKLMMKRFVSYFTDTYGLLSLSHHWRSPLMWAHYAQNHTGVCLGFDIPDEAPREIQYTDLPKTLPIDLALPFGGRTFDDIQTVLAAKSSGWAYEEEWRLFSKLIDRDPDDGEFYLPFTDNLALREIIVGTRCKSSVGSFGKLVKNFDHPVRIIRARPAYETFAMVEQQRVSAINVRPRSKPA